LVGDQVVTQEFINISLRTYAEQRRGVVKPSSVERELKTICPILRAGIETYDLPIVVKKPRIAGSTDFTERYVFTPSEQVELLAVIADKTLRSYAPWKEAAILLMLQTGCNTSEIQRLRCKNVHLEDDVPYIVIAGKTKTKERASPTYRGRG
jgi:integrase